MQGLAIDKAKDNQFMFSFRIAIPSKSGLGQAGGAGAGGGEGSAAAKSSLLTTVIAPTLPAAITLVSGYVNRELSLVHTKVVIFGEPLAKRGLRPALSILARYRELRRNIFICVARGEAREIFSMNTPDLEKSFAKYWEGVKLLQSTMALHPGTLFQEFISASETRGKAGTMIYLAANKNSKSGNPDKLKVPPAFIKGDLAVKSGDIPRTGGDPVEYLGTAVFKGDKLCDVLDFTETRAFLALTGEFRRGMFTMQDPLDKNSYIAIELKQGLPPKVKIDIKNNEVVINEQQSLEGDLLAIQSNINYATDLIKQKLLEKAVEKHIEELSLAMIKRLQKKKIDVIGYGDYARRKFLTSRQWQQFDWLQNYQDAEVNLDVSFKIRRTGLQGSQPGIVP